MAIWQEISDQQNYMRERGLTRQQLQREEQTLLDSLDSESEQVDDAWWDKLHADVLETVAANEKAARKQSA